MAEYVDREKMLKYIEENNTADEWIVGQYNADWIYSFIESQPTADVVEVVRCNDCEYYAADEHRCDHPQLDYEGFCDDFWIDTKPDGFCSYGERRDT